jgi:general stress protein 26
MEDKRQESIKKLNDLIKDIRVAMLTTIDWGVLRSRPMQTQEFEFDGELWFFTSTETHKTEEIEKDRRVNVSYASPESNSYVSVSGTADIVKDHAKIEELWTPIHKAWFPKGIEDPNLVLLKVTVEQAEYWDAPSGTIVQLFGFIKALVTGESANHQDGSLGEHEKVNL